MPVRVRIVAVFCVFAVIVIAFSFLFINQQSTIKTLDQRYTEALSYHQYMENRKSSLQETLGDLDTDAFIENIARTKYGYMKSDELRFVITNPEVLYGTQVSTTP
jgi:cell division protein FtsB